jgi:hypothetical protein
MALAAAVLLFVFDPAGTWWFPPCPLRALTGWLCPFCGSLRAFHALLRGAPRVALGLNPLSTLGILAGLGALVVDTLRPERASRFNGFLSRCFSARGIAIMVAFGVLRNVLDHL